MRGRGGVGVVRGVERVRERRACAVGGLLGRGAVVGVRLGVVVVVGVGDGGVAVVVVPALGLVCLWGVFIVLFIDNGRVRTSG